MRRAAHLLVSFTLATTAVAAETPARKPSPTPAAAAKPRLSLKLKWSTASEVDNYGYFVLRGDTKEGPFKQLNAKAIPGAGTIDTPSRYEFDDPNVVSGRTYYYYLESISVQGQREKFSPVLSRVCCNQPGTAKVEDQTQQHTPAPTPEASPTPAP